MYSQGKMYWMTTFAILWDYQLALEAWASLILPKNYENSKSITAPIVNSIIGQSRVSPPEIKKAQVNEKNHTRNLRIKSTESDRSFYWERSFNMAYRASVVWLWVQPT